MRPINVSLSANTWELAKRKKNFSQWIRLQLHAERRVARELMQLEEDLTQARSAIKQYVKVVDELSKELDKQWAEIILSPPVKRLNSGASADKSKEPRNYVLGELEPYSNAEIATLLFAWKWKNDVQLLQHTW